MEYMIIAFFSATPPPAKRFDCK